MTNTETLTFIGIFLTFVVGLANLIIMLRSGKKNTFINSITSSRIKYIHELRNSISGLCGLVTTYHFRVSKLTYEELFELQKEANKLKFLIRLYLNPEDEYWDSKILSLIDDLILQKKENPHDKIQELITITQYLLKLEWEGVKLESEKGILTEVKKKALYDKYVNIHRVKTTGCKLSP